MKTRQWIPWIVALVLTATLAFQAEAHPAAQGPAPSGPDGDGAVATLLLDQLQEEVQGELRISYHAQTGKVRFIGTTPQQPIRQSVPLQGLMPDATTLTAARTFLTTYGPLFGLEDPYRDLRVMRLQQADRGRSFVRFQQTYQGIPVVGGELIVQIIEPGNVVSVGGEVLPDLDLDTTPTVDAEAARARALELVRREYGLDPDQVEVTDPELWIYNPALLGGPGPQIDTLVWRMEVTPVDLLPIQEFVLVDAHLGFVTLHFNQIDAAKNRVIYDNENDPNAGLPGYGPVATEADPPDNSDSPDAYYAFLHAGYTYDFYSTYHGRDSIDGAGMHLTSTVRYCPDLSRCPYENAFWKPSRMQMVYGEDFALDADVVAHEMTHGVTQCESRLFYYMQSGAINEAFSDIWGEFVDQVYSNGGDNPWMIGEDLWMYSGPFRSMSNPPHYNLPDRTQSALYYCGLDDQGGVHTNMGVGSKAAYLMAAGGTFNNYTVSGLGIEKTAKIWYEVQTHLATSGFDYQDLHDALYQACLNLVGTSGITSSDCQQVRKATLATEMDQPVCNATEAPVCPSGYFAQTLFFDDLETDGSKWETGYAVGDFGWGRDNTWAASGDWHLRAAIYSTQNDAYVRTVPGAVLPTDGTPYLRFDHAYDLLDAGEDGGVVEYAIGGDLDSVRSPQKVALPSGYTYDDIVGIGVRNTDDHVFAWYDDGMVSEGASGVLDEYNGPIPYSLPSGYSPSDIVAMGMRGSDGHVFAWYRDGTVSEGTTTDLGQFSGPTSYALPSGYTPDDIVGAAIALDGRFFFWYDDGTMSAGTSDDLDSYLFPYVYTFLPGLPYTQILGMGAGSGNRTVATYWWGYDQGQIYLHLILGTMGGETWVDAGSLFTDNGYNGTVLTTTNPLYDRSAFVGESYGYLSSRANLSSLAGQGVLVRFRMGVSGGGGGYGWFVDDVHIYTCTEAASRVYLPLVVRNYH